MRSDLPKPLHRVAGLTILEHVLRALAAVDPDRVIVVVGHGRELVVDTVNAFNADSRLGTTVETVVQGEQLGTGHAAQTALAAIDDPESYDVMVLAGDTPLLTGDLLRSLIEQHRAQATAATVLAAELDDPTGYGRLVEGKVSPAGRRRVARIVEHRDATEVERQIRWINTSIYCFVGELLEPTLARLDSANQQGERYLTDVVALLAESGHVVGLAEAPEPDLVLGVNDRAELAEANAAMRARINLGLMRNAGVTMIDPSSVYLDVDVEVGPDVTFEPGVILTGHASVGAGACVGPFFVGHDVVIAAGDRVAGGQNLLDGPAGAPGARR